MKHVNKFLAVGTAAAIAVSSTFAIAAPLGVGSGQLALQNAATSDVIQVGKSGRRNTAIGLGVLGGALLLGGALNGAYAAPQPYYYAAPPPPPPQKCWQQTGPYQGQGRWVWC